MLHCCLYGCSKLTSPATGVDPGPSHPPDGNTELLCKPLRGKSQSKRTTQAHYEVNNNSIFLIY